MKKAVAIYRELENYQAEARKRLPDAIKEWNKPAREFLQKLTRAAMDKKVSDESFVKLLEEADQEFPGLMKTMNTGALAGELENAMGTAMVLGMAAGLVHKEKAEAK
jgi:hypothetical protein